MSRHYWTAKAWHAFSLLGLVVILAGWVAPSQWPAPSGTNTVPIWSGTSMSWGAPPVGGGVTGSGVWHSTSGTLGAAAYLGTAGQFITTNSGATDTGWSSCAGDILCSSSTPGSMTVGSISGSSPIAVTPNSLQWVAGATPNLSQIAAVSGAGANFTITPQAATTTGASGGLTINVAAPASGTTEAGVTIQRGGSSLVTMQQLISNTGYGAIYFGSATPTASNYTLTASSTAGTTYLNGSQINLDVSGTPYIMLGAAQVQYARPIAGASGTPFSWATTGTAIACGTGGTQTISAAQSLTPGLIVTTGTLTSTCILDFSTNAATGYYLVDTTGAGSLGAFGIQFKNGTATQTLTTLPVGGLVFVWTHGANTLAVN